ncbi:MAG: hypothetical protein JXA52_05005 [Planctomycetes bacterium]|nr:hypothetical protein [Planctomycetota bacterium]
MPEETEELEELIGFDNIEEVAEEENASPLQLVYNLAPLILFGFAIVFGLLTLALDPGGELKKRKTPAEYYAAGETALNEVRHPSRPLEAEEEEARLNVARVNLGRLLRHYSTTIDSFNFNYVNPYLLLAEANRLRAESTTIAPLRRELLLSALNLYSMAEVLESQPRQGEAKAGWEKQYLTGAPPIAGITEVDERKKRRVEYIKYQVAEIKLELGWPVEARSALEQLRSAFFQEETRRLRAEKEGKSRGGAAPEYPPIDYELLPVDWENLHYHLARAYDQSDLEELAEREYRVFLLKAPRNNEFFAAKMRLAGMAYARGTAKFDEADFFLGAQRQDSLEAARAEFLNAAEIYTEIVEASAPVNFLQDAYFRAGRSYLSVAAAMDVGTESSWDFINRQGVRLRSSLEDLSHQPMSENSAELPGALGHSLLDDALRAPNLLTAPLRLLIGGGLTLASQERVTPKDKRNEVLQRARSFFDVAVGDATAEGSKVQYLQESRVMIARSLLLENRTSEARRLLLNVLGTNPVRNVRLGTLWGLGHSYLQESQLNQAWQVYKQLPGIETTGDAGLVSIREISRDLSQLGRKYVEEADAMEYPPEWAEVSDRGSMQWSEALRRSHEQKQILELAVNVYELLQKEYNPPDVNTLLTIANLYARRSDLLARPPFGREEDKEQARKLKMKAADTFERIALEKPGSASDAEALLQAGELFFSTGAYERSVESLLLFLKRHGRSEQASEVRNIVGLAYRKMGLYARAELTFRQNARNSMLAEGRKAMYYLGANYLDWSAVEEDHAHLGAPGSRYLRDNLDANQLEGNLLRPDHILDWKECITALKLGEKTTADSPVRRIWSLLSENFTDELIGMLPSQMLESSLKESLLTELNRIIQEPGFYDPIAWRGIELEDEATDLLRRGIPTLSKVDVVRLNRSLLHVAFPKILLGARIKTEDDVIPRTAREVFEQLRRLVGVAPESHPWRWSTFALGETYFEIGRLLKANSESNQEPEAQAKLLEDSREYYRKAETVLREALKRYTLYDPIENPEGIRKEREPDNYLDVQRSRFQATYMLALIHREFDQDSWAQPLLRQLLDENLYGSQVFLREEGPDKIMQRIHRNAYFFLGASFLRTEDYQEAFDVYEQAHDRLSVEESPYLIYMMGECLRKMGRLQEARNKYIQARHAAANAPVAGAGTFATEYGSEYWAEVNEERIADLDYLTLGKNQ